MSSYGHGNHAGLLAVRELLRPCLGLKVAQQPESCALTDPAFYGLAVMHCRALGSLHMGMFFFSPNALYMCIVILDALPNIFQSIHRAPAMRSEIFPALLRAR